MGYCMSQNESSFHMEAADVHKAVKAMQQLGQKGERYHFQSGSEFAKLDNLPDILHVWDWEPDIAESGNVRGINFTGEKAGDEMVMFRTIAPFVKAGSYIEMSGEDGGLWRYVFDGTTCKETYATVSWDE